MERGLALVTSLLLAPATAGAHPLHALDQPEPPGQPETPPPAVSSPADPAHAQAPTDPAAEPIPVPPPIDRGWTFRFEPAYWYAAPRGDITLPGAIGPVEFQGVSFDAGEEAALSDLDADNPSGAFLGRAHFTRDRWRISLLATTLGVSGDSTAAASGRLGDAFFIEGDAISTDFDMNTFEASVAYLIFHGPAADGPGDPTRFRFAFEVLAGARFEHLDVDVRVDPGAGERPPDLGFSAGDSELFGQPIIGARLSMDLFEDFTIEVGFTAGYWSMPDQQTSATWDVLAGFMWRPIDNVGLELGYRNLGLSAESDSGQSAFEYRGSAAGLFAGLVIQF